MKNKKSRNLLEKGCEWLKTNWNPSNHDVPPDLLRDWMYDSKEENPNPSGFQFGVFMFGYFQHALISGKIPPGTPIQVGALELTQRFETWQMKLALAELNRVTDLKSRPLSLFSFEDGQQIEYWHDNAIQSKGGS